MSIMAHPSRSEWARRLSEQTGARITWDRRGDEWDTGRRAWLDHDPSSKWHMVVQDDAVLSPSALSTVRTRLADIAHRGPLSLYVGSARPRAEQVRRYVANADGWFTMPWLLWGVAVVLPTADIDRMIRDADHERSAYDLRISRWYESQGVPTLYAWPCLADHRDQGSLLGHDVGPYPRRAVSFLDT